MTPPKHPIAHRSPFENWKATIDKSKTDSKWNQYDAAIKKAVDEYNRHLSATPGYIPLNWKLIKAMTWTETGAEQKTWASRPIQIGNHGDPGMAVILSGREGSSLIVPPSIKQQLTAFKIQNDANANIQAGIGYLLTKSAIYGQTDVVDTSDSSDHQYTVKPHDNLSKIAQSCGTTVARLQTMNALPSSLKVGQVLVYKKASTQMVISGWKAINTSTIATRYNGGGDPRYREKLDYCLSVMR